LVQQHQTQPNATPHHQLNPDLWFLKFCEKENFLLGRRSQAREWYTCGLAVSCYQACSKEEAPSFTAQRRCFGSRPYGAHAGSGNTYSTPIIVLSRSFGSGSLQVSGKEVMKKAALDNAGGICES